MAGKWATVERNVDAFAEAGFISIRVNSAKVKKGSMLKAFLRTVNKYRR